MSLRLSRPPYWSVALVAAILVADQVTKALVLAAADRLPATVVGGIRLEIVRNTGISFSLFTGRMWLVTLLVCLVTLVMLVLFLTMPRRYSPALALLLGGSLGNLIDRFRIGYVIDFVGVYWWPRFNVADVAIILGAALMVLTVMLHPSMRPVPAETGGAGLPDRSAGNESPPAAGVDSGAVSDTSSGAHAGGVPAPPAPDSAERPPSSGES